MKVADEMLKTKVGDVLQNRKLYNHTLTTLYLDTKRCRICKRKAAPHTDTLSFFPLGIFNLMVQTSKLDLVLKCTQCENHEKLQGNCEKLYETFYLGAPCDRKNATRTTCSCFQIFRQLNVAQL